MARLSLELKPSLNLPSAAVSSSEAADCSYEDLMNHFNLTSSQDLSVLRPVKNWTTPTVVFVDMVLYSIVEVVSVGELPCGNFKADSCSRTSVACERRPFPLYVPRMRNFKAS